MSEVTAFSITSPFCVTIKGVLVRAAISLARNAARTKATGVACMSASLSRETGVGAIAFKCFLLHREAAAFHHHYQTAAKNQLAKSRSPGNSRVQHQTCDVLYPQAHHAHPALHVWRRGQWLRRPIPATGKSVLQCSRLPSSRGSCERRSVRIAWFRKQS